MRIQWTPRNPKYREIRTNFLVESTKTNVFFIRRNFLVKSTKTMHISLRNRNYFSGPIDFGLRGVYCNFSIEWSFQALFSHTRLPMNMSTFQCTSSCTILNTDYESRIFIFITRSGSSRLYRLSDSQAQKPKDSWDERPATTCFVAFLPNFPFFYLQGTEKMAPAKADANVYRSNIGADFSDRPPVATAHEEWSIRNIARVVLLALYKSQTATETAADLWPYWFVCLAKKRTFVFTSNTDWLVNKLQGGAQTQRFQLRRISQDFTEISDWFSPLFWGMIH